MCTHQPPHPNRRREFSCRHTCINARQQPLLDSDRGVYSRNKQARIGHLPRQPMMTSSHSKVRSRGCVTTSPRGTAPTSETHSICGQGRPMRLASSNESEAASRHQTGREKQSAYPAQHEVAAACADNQLTPHIVWQWKGKMQISHNLLVYTTFVAV